MTDTIEEGMIRAQIDRLMGGWKQRPGKEAPFAIKLYLPKGYERHSDLIGKLYPGIPVQYGEQ